MIIGDNPTYYIYSRWCEKCIDFITFLFVCIHHKYFRKCIYLQLWDWFLVANKMACSFERKKVKKFSIIVDKNVFILNQKPDSYLQIENLIQIFPWVNI